MEQGFWLGENSKFVKNIREHHHRLYGKKCKFNTKLGKTNQLQMPAALGPAYASKKIYSSISDNGAGNNTGSDAAVVGDNRVN